MGVNNIHNDYLEAKLPRELGGLGPIAFISWMITSLTMFFAFNHIISLLLNENIRQS